MRGRGDALGGRVLKQEEKGGRVVYKQSIYNSNDNNNNNNNTGTL